MRKVIALLLLITASFCAQAQTAAPKATATSVVIDSTGMKYPAILWQKMVETGDYWLKPLKPTEGDTHFYW